VIIIDSLITAEKETIKRIHEASGRKPIFSDVSLLEHYLDIYGSRIGEFLISADAWIHFAAYKNAPESVNKPLKYYRNNIESLLTALELCNFIGIENFIFSSSATVYGEPQFLPITEAHPIGKANTPYGTTKVTAEWILEDVSASTKLKSVALRYFNPAGADHSGLIGESPIGVPGNLIPRVTKTAVGSMDKLVITGMDFSTPDRTAIRDYIHVSDLAKAHLKALEWLDKQSLNTYETFNIGTGKGTSVLEIIKAFDLIAPGKLNYEMGPRRPGDAAEVWCDPSKAKRILGWEAEMTIHDILTTAWSWEKTIKP
jgi:UDP-glucose 4-epimerase